MIYVILAVVLAVVIIGAIMVRRKGGDRNVSYAPDPNMRSVGGGQVGVRPGPGAVPVIAVPSPELATEDITHSEFVGDVSDDLLDPKNPRHAEWLKDHPDMETDAEWLAEHPEDTPT